MMGALQLAPIIPTLKVHFMEPFMDLFMSLEFIEAGIDGPLPTLPLNS